MDSMLQYLDWRGDIPLEVSPLCPVDLLIFSQLVHAPLERLLTREGTLSALFGLLYPGPPSPVAGPLAQSRYLLWQKAAACPRLSEAELLLFDSRFDEEKELQFAVALFRAGDTGVVAFRGTDGTLVGWKEDLNMSFEEAVPAQQLAARFLKAAVFATGRAGLSRLILTGHSKGGNLAMYAAACCPEAEPEAVYSFDGPGLSERVLGSEGWARVKDRIRLYVPEASIIGMLLGNPGKKTVIDSDSVGILQHDPFKWHVLGTDFVTVKSLTPATQKFNRVIGELLDGCPTEKRRVLVNSVYDLLSVSGAKTLKELPLALLTGRQDVRKVLSLLGEEEKKLLSKLLPLGGIFG